MKKTLTVDSIETIAVTRRSALGTIGLLSGVGALVVVGGANTALAERACTDSDRGANSDTPGHGRGTGNNDSDSGSSGDRVGCGRGNAGNAACSDSDPSDGAGHGRHCH